MAIGAQLGDPVTGAGGERISLGLAEISRLNLS
jgi:hypothetical protein